MAKQLTMTDVRKALHKAYKRTQEIDGRIEGKYNEGWCSVEYPTIWEEGFGCGGLATDENLFLAPTRLTIYSYTLGPSRRHYFVKDDKDSHPNYYTWHTTDIFSKAVEVIESWVKECEDSWEEDIRQWEENEGE